MCRSLCSKNFSQTLFALDRKWIVLHPLYILQAPTAASCCSNRGIDGQSGTDCYIRGTRQTHLDSWCTIPVSVDQGDGDCGKSPARPINTNSLRLSTEQTENGADRNEQAAKKTLSKSASLFAGYRPLSSNGCMRTA